MQLRLRTKLTLVMTGLVLLVAAVLSGVFAAQLLDQLLQATNKRADDLANQVFLQAKHALLEAGQRGLRPASDVPQEIHDFVRHAFEINEGLRTQLKAAKENPLIYEVSITDHQGMVLVSTDENLPGSFLPRRTPLSQLVQRNFLHQVKVLAGPSKVFELDFPFSNEDHPYGEVRVALNAGLLLNEISPSLWTSGTIALLAVVVSTLLAAIVSRATRLPRQPAKKRAFSSAAKMSQATNVAISLASQCQRKPLDALENNAPVTRVTDSATNPQSTSIRFKSSKKLSEGSLEKRMPKCFPFICRSISRYINATPAATAKAAIPSSAMETWSGSSGCRSELRTNVEPPCNIKPGMTIATATGVMNAPITGARYRRSSAKKIVSSRKATVDRAWANPTGRPP